MDLRRIVVGAAAAALMVMVLVGALGLTLDLRSPAGQVVSAAVTIVVLGSWMYWAGVWSHRW